MSLVNLAAIRNAGFLRLPMNDNIAALNASSQSTAYCMPGQLNRVTSSVANGSVVLNSILTEEQNGMVILINDSANAVLVYPTTGEKQNGTLNASLSVAAAATAVFFPVYNDQGGPDWRSAVIS